jgi:hypothetical protein
MLRPIRFAAPVISATFATSTVIGLLGFPRKLPIRLSTDYGPERRVVLPLDLVTSVGLISKYNIDYATAIARTFPRCA